MPPNIYAFAHEVIARWVVFSLEYTILWMESRIAGRKREYILTLFLPMAMNGEKHDFGAEGVDDWQMDFSVYIMDFMVCRAILPNVKADDSEM